VHVDDVGWLVVLVFILATPLGVVYWTKNISDRAAISAGLVPPRGFGGWLVLVVIGQTLAPLVLFINLFNAFDTHEEISRISGGLTIL
jgi:hypothetical protein